MIQFHKGGCLTEAVGWTPITAQSLTSCGGLNKNGWVRPLRIEHFTSEVT